MSTKEEHEQSQNLAKKNYLKKSVDSQKMQNLVKKDLKQTLLVFLAQSGG